MRVIRIFPNKASLLQLGTTLPLERNEVWSVRRYFKPQEAILAVTQGGSAFAAQHEHMLNTPSLPTPKTLSRCRSWLRRDPRRTFPRPRLQDHLSPNTQKRPLTHFSALDQSGNRARTARLFSIRRRRFQSARLAPLFSARPYPPSFSVRCFRSALFGPMFSVRRFRSVVFPRSSLVLRLSLPETWDLNSPN